MNEPGNRGIIRVTQEALNDETLRCHRAGLRVCIHAIGDKAIDVALDAIEEAVKKHPWKGHRHRIEHAGLVERAQLERMARAIVRSCFSPWEILLASSLSTVS
jgi:predicted amidohydrolase YtcJ